jgi:hypothetical protein
MTEDINETEIHRKKWTDRQLPMRDEIFLDHLAHFVPDMPVAEKAMADLGFLLSPFTPQTNAAGPDEPPIKVGLANRCALLERGYLEILTPYGEAETPLAEQLRAALKRYIGVHLLAFSCADPQKQTERLADEGFEPQPSISLQRETITETGSGLLRFSVLRIKPERMPEGRIQFLRHHTPELLWQERWIAHPNGAQALTDVLLCVECPEEVASRFGRFIGITVDSDPLCITTARGRLTIIDVDTAARLLPSLPAISRPFFAAYAIRTSSLERARHHVTASGLQPYDHNKHTGDFWVVGPPGLGGAILFTENPGYYPWWPDK